MKPLTPCLWFAGDAEAAANFYITLVPNSRIDAIFRSPADTPSGPAGSVLTVEFTLNGSPFLALNGDEAIPYNHAVSFQIHTRDQAETDRVWSAILANGGKEVQCGWITDRWGLSWQIVPERLTQLIKDPDPARFTFRIRQGPPGPVILEFIVAGADEMEIGDADKAEHRAKVRLEVVHAADLARRYIAAGSAPARHFPTAFRVIQEDKIMP